AVEPRTRDLVPPNHPLAVRGDDLLDAADEPDVVRRLRRRRLVAADVDERPGREPGELPDHVGDEVVDDRLADAERAEADVDARVERGRLAVARELRVGGEGRMDVAGHVDLGDDLDVPRRRVPNEVGVLALRVVAAPPSPDLAAPAVRREPGPLLDRDAPAL